MPPFTSVSLPMILPLLTAHEYIKFNSHPPSSLSLTLLRETPYHTSRVASNRHSRTPSSDARNLIDAPKHEPSVHIPRKTNGRKTNVRYLFADESGCVLIQQRPIDTCLRLFARNPWLAFDEALDELVIQLESLIRVPKTRSLFHRPAQRNAFRRRDVRQQSRLFASRGRNWPCHHAVF